MNQKQENRLPVRIQCHTRETTYSQDIKVRLLCSWSLPILPQNQGLQKQPALRIGQVCSCEKLKHLEYVYSFNKYLLSTSVHQHLVSLSVACVSKGFLCYSPITTLETPFKGLSYPLFLSWHIHIEHTEVIVYSQITSQSVFQHFVYSCFISQQFLVSTEDVIIEDKKETKFHFSKLKRRQDIEKKRKIRKIEWMRQM